MIENCIGIRLYMLEGNVCVERRGSDEGCVGRKVQPIQRRVYNERVRSAGFVQFSADGESSYNHVWTTLSYGRPDYYKGQWAECTNPARAAELFLVLDYMAGYLDDEIQRTYWKVKSDFQCRRIRKLSKV